MFDYFRDNKIDAILLLIFFISVVIFSISKITDDEIAICSESDIYEVQEWQGCQPSGIETRTVIKKSEEDIDCNKLQLIEKPIEIRTCEYIPLCSEDDVEMGEWGECEEGKKNRTIKFKKNCKIPDEDSDIKFATEMDCEILANKTYILKDYTTQVDAEAEKPYYDLNKHNIKISVNGKVEEAKLFISVETTVLGGKSIKIPEYYYIIFELNDSQERQRAIGTSRIAPSRFDLSSDGIFKGTETPITLDFDLRKLELANESPLLGSEVINFVEIMNNNNTGVPLPMTLFVGDGRSMIHPDIKERIFATITNAYIEYNCEEGTECEIVRTPPLKPELE